MAALGGVAIMNDRTEGSLKQAKGDVKTAAGKLVGDEKLKAEGRGEKIAGKVQNAFGGVKDAIKGKTGR